ncbi:folate-binding protein YgfZ [Rhodanobacter sp. C03]|uniref:CAF17-like 4Fe-4S cluster assembly/insertion protein YgfZ n=1 Tax=Rhodanobacter sp. C03 TaxID=1945858 RepID=UPI000984D814|nr:folate-binding protein YgfZ [Rhodanobacter sp. C03]
MPTPYPAETLLIEGTDAIAFAQAQFSSQVNSLSSSQWQFSAWLDPQGRVRALFHLARLADDRLLLLLRGGSATAMVDALRRFMFRSKLTLTALSPRALTTGPAQPMHAVHEDAETLSLGCGTHSMRITNADQGDDAWRLPQLHAGWPWLPVQRLNELLPPALSLHRLQAVAIDKGCYPGQEIVARLHYRGGNKRHLHGVILSQAANAGEVLRRDERDIGCLLNVISNDNSIEALALLNDDVVAQANDGRLNAFDDHGSIRLVTTWPE